MRKQNKERHSKTWTLIRLIVHIGILLLEVFGAYLLLLYIQQPIAHIAYMIFLVLPSVTTVAVYWNNYKKKNFKSMVEEDLQVDQMWAKQYGATYYIWKALTLPFVRKNGTPDINKEIVEICVKVILEREELKKQLKVSDDALELACYKLTDFENAEKESMHSSQYWYDYLKQKAREMMKSEKRRN